MNTITLLLSLALCLAIANARTFEEKRRENDPLSVVDDEAHKSRADLRHRRRRWQMSYGYDYPTPLPTYYPERRDYDRSQQDLLLKIVKLLEDISVNLNRPQPPPTPQPIYISYPIPYPVPSFSNPCSSQVPNKVNITSRFPDMEDTNQNWGFALTDDDNSKNVGDGSRPISFDPIKPPSTLLRPAPNVEHGSVQLDSLHTTQAPKFESDASLRSVPVMCKAAVLSCCANDKQQQLECFNNFGCTSSFDNGRGCNAAAVNEALEAFRVAYSPIP